MTTFRVGSAAPLIHDESTNHLAIDSRRPLMPASERTLRTNPVGLQTYDKEALTFFLSSDLKATPQLDEDSMERSLANRSPADARDYLSRTLLLAQEPEVVVQPNWLGMVPPFAWRINLVIVPREG